MAPGLPEAEFAADDQGTSRSRCCAARVHCSAQTCTADPALLVSTLKPAEKGAGFVLRVLNPTEESLKAGVRLGFPFDEARPVRLDEESGDDFAIVREGSTLRFAVPPHALETVWIH